MKLSHDEWCARYSRMRQIADRIAAMRNQRARDAMEAAGLGREALGIMPHNAMCAYRQGHPWREVDYSKVRLCLNILEREFEGHRILERWHQRVSR